MSRLALAGAWTPWIGGAAGLVLGSFLNVCALALAGGPSPLRRRSSCPHCGRRLAWRDLAPVISYLQLGGRCRYCGVRLSLLYPLGELAAGLAVGLSLARFGASPQALACMVFCLALVVIALVDARAGIVPDLVVLPATAAALLASFWLPAPGFLPALAGALLIAGGLWAVARAYRALRGREGLGMGDVKLAGLMGAYLGAGAAGLAVSLAAGAGLVFYLGAWAAGRAAWDARLPFAPFLALGGAAMALAGGDIIHFLYGI